jgi:hypothetical protein
MTPRLEPPGTERFVLGILAERRPATSPWAEHGWRAVEALVAPPDLPDWTVLREADGRTLFFAGLVEVALYPTDTPNYLENLAADPPRLFVVLRPVDAAPGMALLTATVDVGEVQQFADSGADLLESLPMPEAVHAAVARFVAAHHVERAFHKRRRDRADPEALGRRRPGP